MARALVMARSRRDHTPRDPSPRAHQWVRVPRHPENHPMQWQTPTATDFRFGFEITMYVAAR